MALAVTALSGQPDLSSLLAESEEILREVFTSDISDVKRLLERINSFLQHSAVGDDSYTLKATLRQLREVAYDTEDIVDELMLLSGRSAPKGSRFISRFATFVKYSVARGRISAQVRGIAASLREIKERYKQATNFNDRETPANATRCRLDDHHLASLCLDEAELVGVDGPKKELIKWLLEKEAQLKVKFVVGMAGLGKTTLLRSIYNHEEVKGWFQCHAWVTVTPSFSIKDLMRSVVNQIFEERQEQVPESIHVMDEFQLEEIIRRYLKDKRYLIVFDDVWSSNVLDDFKYALPNDVCGSRIIVATRILEVAHAFQASLPSPVDVYNLKPLNDFDAWLLFCKKAFQSLPGASCPLELERISREVVRKCSGLPLGIVAIGGLLSKKERDVNVWQEMLGKLNWEIGRSPRVDNVTKILSISYGDLPYPLRSCFLYFSMFPKNYSIKRMTLIRLWIAEGFLKSEAGRTMEDIAEGYLKELIDRGMVQVAEFYNYGRVRSCRIHDRFREIVILKSEEENFSTFLTREVHKIDGMIRRLSVLDTSDDLIQNISSSYLRALFIFRSNAINTSSMINSFFAGFKLLRILDLEGAPVETLPVEFANLLHLRYLSLRNTRISKLPKSLRKLINLQTLDLKGTYVTQLPSEITKLKSLRHLLAYHYYTGRLPPYYYALGVKVPRGIGRLTQLQKLMYIDANQESGVLNELASLTELKRLGIVKLREQDGVHLCSSVARMKELLSFSAASLDIDEHLVLNSLVPPEKLERLYLRGPLAAIPPWVCSLKNLVRMRLRWSRLSENSLNELHALQCLIELSLIQAYEGETLCFNQGFDKLKIFELDRLDNLKSVDVKGAMPNLQKMYIRSCKNLLIVPEGINQLRNLKELHLFDMPKDFLHKFRRGGIDRCSLEHIPVIRSYNNQDRIYEDL